MVSLSAGREFHVYITMETSLDMLFATGSPMVVILSLIIIVNGADRLSTDITGLASATTYLVQVAGINDKGIGDYITITVTSPASKKLSITVFVIYIPTQLSILTLVV